MKQRTLIRSIAAATAVLSTLPLLSGCGQSLAKASKPLPASQAFALEGIWYYVDTDDKGQVVADDDVEAIIDVDNKGNAKWYQLNKDFPISSLERMKPEQVLEYAKKSNQEFFEDRKKMYLDRAQYELTYAQEYVDDHQQRLDDIEESYASALEEAEEQLNSSLGDIYQKRKSRLLADKQDDIEKENKTNEERENVLNVAKKVSKETKAVKYSEPKTQQLKLQIVPDATGSSTDSEYLVAQNAAYNSAPTISVDSKTKKITYSKFAKTETLRFRLNPLSYTQPMSSLHFGGYYESGHALVTAVNEKHAGFILDQPDVKAENASIKKDE